MYRAGTRRVWGQRIVPVECNWGGAGRRPSASGPEIRSDVVDAMRSDASRGCGVAPFEGLGDPAGSLGPQEGHTLPPRGIIFSASISLASHAVAPAGNSIKRPYRKKKLDRTRSPGPWACLELPNAFFRTENDHGVGRQRAPRAVRAQGLHPEASRRASDPTRVNRNRMSSKGY